MTSRILLLVFVTAMSSSMAWADDILVRTELPLKTPRSRDPVLGGSRDKAYFSVWIPDGVKTLRGGMCNPFSKDQDVSKHWKAICRRWNFAFVQTDFDAVKKDDFGLLKTALAELAKKAGHPEIEHLPLCFTGMSRGGGISMQLAELMPERTIAVVPVCLEVGPKSDATRRIPVLTIFGEKDGSQMTKLLTKLPIERKLDARWGIAVQWGRRHEFGQANNLSFVFLDEIIARRLPKVSALNKPPVLGDIPLEDGWIGNQDTWSKDGTRPTITPWREFKRERSNACWLPSQRAAAVWQAFVAADKSIVIAEPAGLGDGQAFRSHSAAKPINVTLKIGGKATPSKVELWDGHECLGEKNASPWTFDVALRPGVHALIATVHAEGQPIRAARPHTIVVGE